MLTYRQLRRRKEFHDIKEIGERLEQRDIKENNINYKGICVDGEDVSEWIKKTYWFDIWYAFELLDWIKNKRHTL
jgi:hypothetical protein